MKKILFFILIIAVAVFAIGCQPKTETKAELGVPNPMKDYASLKDLLADVQGVVMHDVPKGSLNISYASIDGDPKIAQIIFTLDQDTYTYRSATFSNQADASDSIAGMYVTWSAVSETETNGIKYTFKSNAEGDGLAAWVADGCQYTVTFKTSQDPATVFGKVAQYLIPSAK